MYAFSLPLLKVPAIEHRCWLTLAVPRGEGLLSLWGGGRFWEFVQVKLVHHPIGCQWRYRVRDIVTVHKKSKGAAGWKRGFCGTTAAYEGCGRTLESQNASACYARHEDGIKTELWESARGLGLPAPVAES